MDSATQTAPLTQASSGSAEILHEEHLVIDLAHDILRSKSLPFDAIFKPKSVALIGASGRTGRVSHMVTSNLISASFGGRVYPVDCTRSNTIRTHL